MQTIVATWNHQTETGEIHLTLDGDLIEREVRYRLAEAKVAELESQNREGCVEVILAHARTLAEFKATDPRFLDAPQLQVVEGSIRVSDEEAKEYREADLPGGWLSWLEGPRDLQVGKTYVAPNGLLKVYLGRELSGNHRFESPSAVKSRVLKYRLRPALQLQPPLDPLEEAFVYLAIEDPHQQAELLMDGPAPLLTEIRLNLEGSSGLRGGLIGRFINGYDLECVMNSWTMKCFQPELIEGDEILEPPLSEEEEIQAQGFLRHLKQVEASAELIALANRFKIFRRRLYLQAKIDLLEESFPQAEHLQAMWNDPFAVMPAFVGDEEGKEATSTAPLSYALYLQLAMGDLGDVEALGRAARTFLGVAISKNLYPSQGPKVLYDTLLRHEKSGRSISQQASWPQEERFDFLRYTLELQCGFKGSHFDQDIQSMRLDEISYYQLSKRFEAFPEARPKLYSRLCQLLALSEQEGNETAKKRLALMREGLFRELEINPDTLDQAFQAFRIGQAIEVFSKFTRKEWEFVIARMEDSYSDLAAFMEQLKQTDPERYEAILAIATQAEAATANEG